MTVPAAVFAGEQSIVLRVADGVVVGLRLCQCGDVVLVERVHQGGAVMSFNALLGITDPMRICVGDRIVEVNGTREGSAMIEELGRASTLRIILVHGFSTAAPAAWSAVGDATVPWTALLGCSAQSVYPETVPVKMRIAKDCFLGMVVGPCPYIESALVVLRIEPHGAAAAWNRILDADDARRILVGDLIFAANGQKEPVLMLVALSLSVTVSFTLTRFVTALHADSDVAMPWFAFVDRVDGVGSEHGDGSDDGILVPSVLFPSTPEFLTPRSPEHGDGSDDWIPAPGFLFPSTPEFPSPRSSTASSPAPAFLFPFTPEFLTPRSLCGGA